jgi:hypothetical protein
MAWTIVERPEQLHVDELCDFDERVEKNFYIAYPTTHDYQIKKGFLRGSSLANVIRKNLIIKDVYFDGLYGTNPNSQIYFSAHAYDPENYIFIFPPHITIAHSHDENSDSGMIIDENIPNPTFGALRTS